jgi:hypothetical protein
MATAQGPANHTRRDPLFHFFLVPVVAVTVVIEVAGLIRHPSAQSAWGLILAIAAIVAVFKIRLYALKIQDRVIRLEERLRLATLLSPELSGRVSELSEGQLIGLRFAGDAEVPDLVAKTLATNLSGKDIKRSIRNWRPDDWRV